MIFKRHEIFTFLEQTFRNSYFHSYKWPHLSMHCAQRSVEKPKKNDQLRENDIEALDAVTVERVIVETSAGPVERKILAPIPKSKNSNNDLRTISESLPETIPNNEYLNIDNVDMEDSFAVPPEKTKARLY
jgi:hypothetical protein